MVTSSAPTPVGPGRTEPGAGGSSGPTGTEGDRPPTSPTTDISRADNAPRTTSGATLEFRHVTKSYRPGIRGREAVKDVSFTVPAGKVCVIVGPSGCGKTTTLKMVNRLIEPTSGQILIDGRDVTKENPTSLRRRIGYVIQQVGLFPHLTIGENVAVVPRLLGWSSERQRERTDELLSLVGLNPTSYRDRYPSQLSGGERQRVGVARALAGDPPVMLMDEPFGAIDPIVRERLQNEFLRLQRDLAKTILFVTHDVDEAIKMGDLIAVMEQGGRLAQFGPPDEILAHPASEFVARFVGVDRGLKRLSLLRVGELELPQPVTARPGERAHEARQRVRAHSFPYLLLVDREDRPIGWVGLDALPIGGMLDESLASSASPLLEPETTVKDALSLLLASDVQAGIAVDRAGRVQGLLTVDSIGLILRGQPLLRPEPDGLGPVGPGRPAEDVSRPEETVLGSADEGVMGARRGAAVPPAEGVPAPAEGVPAPAKGVPAPDDAVPALGARAPEGPDGTDMVPAESEPASRTGSER